MLTAVAQDGRALQCAAAPLRADKEVVLGAIATKLSALRFADGGIGKTELLEESARRKGQP